MDYERFALIYDSESGQLGSTALALLEAEIDTLYAADLNEAMLLAGQEKHRLGALLVPSLLEEAQLTALIERVCPYLSGGVETLVPAGPEPAPEIVSRLRRAGVRWCLWDPFESADLRFVTTAALMSGNPGERRKNLRVPANLDGELVQDEHRVAGIICDLSPRGAYVGLEGEFETGSELDVELKVGHSRVSLRARVAHGHSADDPPRAGLPGGIGIEFMGLGAQDRAAVTRLLGDLTAGFRL